MSDQKAINKPSLIHHAKTSFREIIYLNSRTYYARKQLVLHILRTYILQLYRYEARTSDINVQHRYNTCNGFSYEQQSQQQLVLGSSSSRSGIFLSPSCHINQNYCSNIKKVLLYVRLKQTIVQQKNAMHGMQRAAKWAELEF